MIRKNTETSANRQQNSPNRMNVGTATEQPKLTIFAIPKKFEGHVDIIQSNAIHSWVSLQPQVEVILFGDANNDTRLRELAEEMGARVYPLQCSESGTPLINDAFEQIQVLGNGDTFCYTNCDIIFDSGLLDVVARLQKNAPEPFLAIGRRIDADMEQRIDFSREHEARQIFERAKKDGRAASIVCKDYFVFSPTAIKDVPEFRVGRGNWDNWMVAEAKQKGLPVIDLSSELTAIHQNHNYEHIPGGRRKAYVSGPEARLNQRLAGGRRLIKGSTADWELVGDRIRKRQFPAWQMAKDIPHFVRLLRNLLFLGYFLGCLAFPF